MPTASPKTLTLIRIAQLVLAVAYLTLLAWSNSHKGWWLNIVTPFAVGTSTALTTLAYIALNLWTKPFNVAHTASIFERTSGALQTTYSPPLSTLKVYLLAFIEILFAALWSASFICMLLPKGKDFKKLFVRPPYETWDVGVALAVCEIIAFTWSAWTVLREKENASILAREFSSGSVPLARARAGPYERM